MRGLFAAGAVAAPLAFGSTEVWAYWGLQALVAVSAPLKTAGETGVPAAAVMA